MRPLIAIITCHKFKARADAQRRTWLKNCTYEYKFFLSKSDTPAGDDEIYLDAPDEYLGLPHKVQAMCQWAVANGYDAVLKCDDDTYIFPERLRVPQHLYSGRLNVSRYDACPFGWCSGFAYWLTGEALHLVANAPSPTDTAEDLWVGRTLSAARIKCIANKTFMPLSTLPHRMWGGFANQVIAACEFPAEKMFEIHDLFTNPARINEIHESVKLGPRFGRRIQRRR